MLIQSSYIFLEHPFKEKKEIRKEDGPIVLKRRSNLHDFISKIFPYVNRIDDKVNSITTQFTGTLYSCNVQFNVRDVRLISYLDISVEGKKIKKVIDCLEKVQKELLESDLITFYWM